MLNLITVGFLPYLPTPAGVSFTVPVTAASTWEQVVAAVDDRLHSLVEQKRLTHADRRFATADLLCMLPRQFGWLTPTETAHVLFQIDLWQPPRRWHDAIAAQEGACNPVALVNSLSRALKEVETEGGGHPQMRQDAACQALAHQLAFILNTGYFDEHYADRMDLVRGMVQVANRQAADFRQQQAAEATHREDRP